MIRRLARRVKRWMGPEPEPSRKARPQRKKAPDPDELRKQRIADYLDSGRVPWSVGYEEYKWETIERNLADESIVSAAGGGTLPEGYGLGIDERVVEYPWSFHHTLDSTGPILDAGSVLNYEAVVNNPRLDSSRLTIAGLAVEKNCFYEDGVSYQLCDLRDLPFRDDWFELTLSISTLEHIGMNNEIYGHANEAGDTTEQESKPTDAYLPAVQELVRVTRPGGKIAITVPVGRFEHHGFFQQFDRAMIDSLRKPLEEFGAVTEQFFLYEKEGWRAASWEDCRDAQSHNPHSGSGKGTDGAAHCRAIGCFVARGNR